ncbi:tetratricopeptide repeat protein [Cupriavidus sp. TMH.W2]|uniref:tetratricopeptide repeat protein n=1 Tax=Cupriavidus sp. TMH.W2 TaxID=3434465 RepID=UPI003D789863
MKTLKIFNSLRHALIELFVVATSLLLPIIAHAMHGELQSDFEGNNMTGRIIYRETSTGLSVEYHSPSLNKILLYSVQKFDDCSSMTIYKIPNTRQIAIDGSCSSQGGQIYRLVYEWKRNYSNWCLVREITGERSDLTAGKFLPSEQVLRTKDCSGIGTTEAYAYESSAETAKDIERSLESFESARKDADTLDRYLNSITAYDSAELAEYVSTTNVRDINDIAHFLAEKGRSDDAIPLLEAILKKFPKRIVTKLNLADAYWNIGIKVLASQLYDQYYHDMTSNNMKPKIPPRVIDRMK